MQKKIKRNQERIMRKPQKKEKKVNPVEKNKQNEDMTKKVAKNRIYEAMPQ